MLGQLLETLSGHWAVHLESRVPRTELYEARIASSKPSLGFFILLISSAVIASLGLISNRTAVVIGAMIVAPLMDPILSLAFGLAVSDGKLIRRSGGDWNRGVDQFGTGHQLCAVGDHRPHVSQPDRGGIVSAFSGEPDRNHRHQPCGVLAAALRLIPQLLAQSSGLVGIARAVEPALVIGIA